MKTINEILEEIVKEYKTWVGSVKYSSKDIEAIVKSTHLQIQSETEKRVRRETIEEVKTLILYELKTIHDSDCDRVVYKYPKTERYRECGCGASRGDYSLSELHTKLTNLLNEKE